ncbi:unnamed protein product [Ceratitis capitata]|uniref:Gustatory receptor n=1 Tax=Ceratitis capitata TaxID=7213 RepID=A0A811U987_CERCA|nr:unnamed protein product [Ceratitis capitata]
MRPATYTSSALVSALTPYFWAFSLFAVVLPPCVILRTVPTQRQWSLQLFRAFFALYILAQLATSCRVTYINSAMISRFVVRSSSDGITWLLSLGINVVQLIVQIVLYYQALTGHQLLTNMLFNVMELERDIRQHCKNECTLASIRWRFRLRIGVWFLIICIVFPYLNYELATTSLTPLPRVLTVLFCTIVQLKGVEYCMNAQLVQELLHLVQKQLLHLRHELLRCEDVERRRIIYTDLQTNQNLLSRIWDLLNQVERYFCIPMLTLFFYNGFSITQTIHWGYINFELDDLNLRLCRIAFAVVIITTLFIPCYFSQCCIDEYNRFGTMLHKLKTVGIDELLAMRLQEYSLQLMHQQMMFTCGGLFDINLKNFGAVRKLA